MWTMYLSSALWVFHSCRMISTGREGQSEEPSLFRTKISHLNEEVLSFVLTKTVGTGLRISCLKIWFSRCKKINGRAICRITIGGLAFFFSAFSTCCFNNSKNHAPCYTFLKDLICTFTACIHIFWLCHLIDNLSFFVTIPFHKLIWTKVPAICKLVRVS